MEPFTLTAGDLTLDSLVDADIPHITRYCQDPLFEKYLTVPWPYSEADAAYFVSEIAHGGWARGDELTWAIRREGALLGVVSVRAGSGMIGYWIGAEHRGAGAMTRAVTAVIDWVFASGWNDIVRWEARIGNIGSLIVARKTGFRYVDIGPAFTPSRDGSSPDCWRAELHAHDDRSVKDGWPDLDDLVSVIDETGAGHDSVAPSPWESSRVHFEVETTVPTAYGTMRFRAYRDRLTGADHLAVIAGKPGVNALVRVHSECLTGEVFDSLKCECGPQLQESLEMIQRESGIVIYLRGHEGRGIGLINKLRAYELQEGGLDTLDANLALDLPADSRDYGAAVAILGDLDITSVRLLTNNPEKARQLSAQLGLTVSETIPLLVGVGKFNSDYLATKRNRMGHQLPDDLAGIAKPDKHTP